MALDGSGAELRGSGLSSSADLHRFVFKLRVTLGNMTQM